MFDGALRPLIDPTLDSIARVLSRTGLSANTVTYCGLIFGLAACVAAAFGSFWLALLFVGLNRLADGLDGPLARLEEPTDLGGYNDIVFDFLFYGGVPLAFAVYDPEQNALAAATLLASFYANGAAFLAFSALAAKRGLATSAQGPKAIYYLAGIAEGAETIAVFIAFCLVPAAFAPIAYVFAGLCFISALARIVMVQALLRDD